MNKIKFLQKKMIKDPQIRDYPPILFSYALKSSEESGWISDALANDAHRTFVRLLEFAEEGDIVSQNQIGFWFAHGVTVLKNTTIAANWYQKAIAGGNSKALANLAVLLLGESELATDIKRGIHLLDNSMGMEDAKGYFWKAQCHRLGLGVERSKHCAQDCFLKAKREGCLEAGWYLKSI